LSFHHHPVILLSSIRKDDFSIYQDNHVSDMISFQLLIIRHDNDTLYENDLFSLLFKKFLLRVNVIQLLVNICLGNDLFLLFYDSFDFPGE